MTTTPSRRWFSLCNCGLSHEPRLNRRDLLIGGAATLAFGAVAIPDLVPKAAAQARPHRIDVHHHISPPSWIDALKSMKKDTPPVTNWSVQKTHRGHGRRRRRDRDDVADHAAACRPGCADRGPRRAGSPTNTPRSWRPIIPAASAPGRCCRCRTSTRASKAIEYAFDTLKVDGVGIMTSYGDKWLGYQEFEPVWAGAEPPQGHRLHSPDRRQLLRQSGSRHRRSLCRIRHRHDAHRSSR